MVIEKKIWPEHFEAIRAGQKKFELRLGDFTVAEGDTLVLEEFDPKTQSYSGRTIERRVGSVLRFHPNKLPFYTKDAVAQHGLQVISLLD